MAQRLPASVYRRRRLVVLLAVVAIIALIWWAIAALGSGGSGETSPTTTPATTMTAGPAATTPAPTSTDALAGATPTPSGPPTCTRDSVEVAAATNAPSYSADQQPQLTMTVTNTSDEPCLIDVGTATQVFTITSGVDTIWVSSDCLQEPTHELVELAAGQQISGAGLAWVRERSTPATCADPQRPAAAAGGATYYLKASVGGLDSELVSFILL